MDHFKAFGENNLFEILVSEKELISDFGDAFGENYLAELWVRGSGIGSGGYMCKVISSDCDTVPLFRSSDRFPHIL